MSGDLKDESTSRAMWKRSAKSTAQPKDADPTMKGWGRGNDHPIVPMSQLGHARPNDVFIRICCLKMWPFILTDITRYHQAHLMENEAGRIDQLSVYELELGNVAGA
jgi:hypothetical protein